MKYAAVTIVLLMAGACVLAQSPSDTGSSPNQPNAFFTGPGTHGASLNGAPLLPGTAVLEGETVHTDLNGVAILAPTHGSGGVIELGGGSSGTVRSGNYQPALGSDQFEITSGSSMVTGTVSVTTPQGQIFQPANSDTSYVVDAAQKTSTMGVLSGAVRTLSPSQVQTSLVPAGDAIQVATNSSGGIQLSNIKFNDVTKPSTSNAVTQTVPESNTGQAGGGR